VTGAPPPMIRAATGFFGNGSALKSGHDHCIPVRHTQDICQTFAKYVRRVPVKTSP
jgi:hypothetical protein